MHSHHYAYPATPPVPSTRHSALTFSLSSQCISPTSVLPLQAVHPALNDNKVSAAQMAKLLLGDAGTPSTESTHEALSDHLVLHRPRTDSITSTASLDCLAEVAQRELDLRIQQHRRNQLAFIRQQQLISNLMHVSQRNAAPLDTGSSEPYSGHSAQIRSHLAVMTEEAEHTVVKSEQTLQAPLAFYLEPSDISKYNKSGRIGVYLPKQRDQLLKKFYRRRQQRIWHKKVRYSCRKNLANDRLRIKGRFVKSDSPEAKAHQAAQAAKGQP